MSEQINILKKYKFKKNNIKFHNLNFIELCAGGGGMSSGFINKGFKPLLLNDNDKHCCKTLQINHPNIPIMQDTMKNTINYINTNNISKNIDVLAGGIPCQSFSLIGKRKGLKDSRGNLMLEFIKIIEILKPKIFIIENVKGLVNHDNGKTFSKIISLLSKIGLYNIYHDVLNANNYSVPQKRERLIIIGTHKSINKQFKFPIPHSYKPILKDVLYNVPKSEGIEYNEEKEKIMKLVPQGGCWVNLPEDIQKTYMKKSYYSGGGKRGIARRLSMNEPSLTLLTTPSQKQTERCHPLETRPLNVREYARIQTFPDNYKFSGSIHQQYKQIGNAVPVKLCESLAQSIIEVLC